MWSGANISRETLKGKGLRSQKIGGGAFFLGGKEFKEEGGGTEVSSPEPKR